MRIIEIGFLTLVLHLSLSAQQASPSGSCSAAPSDGTGIIQIRCSGLNAAQATLIGSLPDVINKLLVSRDRPADILRALNTCAASIRGQVQTYSFDGAAIFISDPANGSKTAVAGRPPDVFSRMQNLERGAEWAALISLCEETIAKMPDWLTPRYYEAVAKSKSGHVDEAIQLLKFVKEQAGGDPEYAGAGELLKQLGAK